MNRRTFLRTASAGVLYGAVSAARAQQRAPNVILMAADDLGYGDLGCYGSRLRTPNIDRMAADGVRFVNFYAASSVCSPSRAALLTGRYPVRSGLVRVLQADDAAGLPESETTIAQMLKGAGYRTMCIGKWHLGASPDFLPTNRGFDEYYGIPYSNDMWPLPLLRNTDVIEEPARLESLTSRFTEAARAFIAQSKDAPFFLYLAHSSPHIPLATSERFNCRSPLGPYGDVVEELDWSVGEVLRAVQENGLDENTLVMFLSDNGPWYQGSAGRLRGRKGETLEGGMRVPFIARFSGRTAKGVACGGVATAMDILPTLARLCGAPLPGNPLDGVDIWPLLSGEREDVERGPFLYFNGWDLQCARLGRWKLHVSRYTRRAWNPDPPGGCLNLPLPRPELYDLEADPEECYDVARDHPAIVSDIRARIELMLPAFPEPVLTVWRETMSSRVENTPAGALPVRAKS